MFLDYKQYLFNYIGCLNDNCLRNNRVHTHTHTLTNICVGEAPDDSSVRKVMNLYNNYRNSFGDIRCIYITAVVRILWKTFNKCFGVSSVRGKYFRYVAKFPPNTSCLEYNFYFYYDYVYESNFWAGNFVHLFIYMCSYNADELW